MQVSAPVCTGDPVPMELGVKFQPSMLGECRALLVIHGPGGGESLGGLALDFGIRFQWFSGVDHL